MPMYKARLEAEQGSAAVGAPSPPPVISPQRSGPSPVGVAEVRPSPPRRVTRAATSASVSAWLEAPNVSAVERASAWLCASAEALHADWLHARRHYVRDGDREEQEFFDANARWAAALCASLHRAASRAAHRSVSGLLDEAERVIVGVAAPDVCPPRDAMLLRVEAVWRRGDEALALAVDAGDAPFDA
jgi:hypothetical protein